MKEESIVQSVSQSKRNLLSSVLGYAVVLGSTSFKIPQIVRILSSRSVEGLSPSTYLLELFSQSVNITYYVVRELPISTWGEFVFIGFQNLVILFLYVRFYKESWNSSTLSKQQKKKEKLAVQQFRRRALFSAFSTSAIVTLLFMMMHKRGISIRRIFTPRLLSILPLCSTLIYVGSRLPQVIKNFCEQSTGELSPSTWFLNALGGAIRIFTTLKQVKDPVVLTSFIASTLVNTTVLAQIGYYGKKHKS